MGPSTGTAPPVAGAHRACPVKLPARADLVRSRIPRGGGNVFRTRFGSRSDQRRLPSTLPGGPARVRPVLQRVHRCDIAGRMNGTERTEALAGGAGRRIDEPRQALPDPRPDTRGTGGEAGGAAGVRRYSVMMWLSW